MLTLAFNIAAQNSNETEIKNQLTENAASINGVEVLSSPNPKLEMEL